MGEENQTIDSFKKLPTQTEDGGGKPNYSGRESKLSEEMQSSILHRGENAPGQCNKDNYISCRGEDVSNVRR